MATASWYQAAPSAPPDDPARLRPPPGLLGGESAAVVAGMGMKLRPAAAMGTAPMTELMAASCCGPSAWAVAAWGGDAPAASLLLLLLLLLLGPPAAADAGCCCCAGTEAATRRRRCCCCSASLLMWVLISYAMSHRSASRVARSTSARAALVRNLRGGMGGGGQE